MQRNRLAAETSPYLQQHADNPVDWYPWGEAALAAAKRDGKPILLSIGYSACHWCHVMAHESFEDANTAALMNELFVNIKVDREERPDLDKIYQIAQQLITHNNGGWPLTMFLTPAQQPFFGGTYFPKHARHGLPAFSDLLRKVADYYKNQSAAIGDQNRQMRDTFAALAPQSAAPDTLLSGRAAPNRAGGSRTLFRFRVRRLHPGAEVSASRQHRALHAGVVRHLRAGRSRSQSLVYGKPDHDAHGRGRSVRSAGAAVFSVTRSTACG